MVPVDDRRIVFDNVSKSYGEVLGVNQVNLSIEPGITSLVGPNGAGKTTLVEMIEGIQQPDAGSITLFGLTWKAHAGELRRRGHFGRVVEAFWKEEPRWLSAATPSLTFLASTLRRGVSARTRHRRLGPARL